MQIETGNLDTIPRLYWAAFRQAYPGDEHLHLACHAAFPIALTTDLLYKIWLNFRKTTTTEDPLELLSTVSDLLHSDLFREVGRDLYEMQPDIRELLISTLQTSEAFGEARVFELARFLRDYLQYNPEKIPTLAFKEAQSWLVASYLEPEKAAKLILDLLQQEEENPDAGIKIDYFLSWAKERNKLNQVSGNAGDALMTAEQMVRGIRQYKAGDLEGALERLRPLEGLFTEGEGKGGKGFKTKIPTEVWNALRSDSPLKNDYSELDVSAYTPDQDANLIVIGNPRVGKTTLIKQLFHNTYSAEENSTHGLQILEVDFDLQTDNRKINLSVWDIGNHGSSYILSHVPTKNTFFIVVWDPENEYSHQEVMVDSQEIDSYFYRLQPIHYWLSLIRSWNKNANIIVVQSKADKYTENLFERTEELTKVYNIRAFISHSAISGNSIPLLQEQIRESLQTIYEQSILLPNSWRDIKLYLKALKFKKKFIDIQEYNDICGTHGIDIKSSEELQQLLINSHVILRTDGYVVLDKIWVFNAVFTLFDRVKSHSSLKNSSILTKEDLAELWKGYTNDEIKLLLKLLISLEICVLLDNKTDNPKYIILELLPEQPESSLFKILDDYNDYNKSYFLQSSNLDGFSPYYKVVLRLIKQMLERSQNINVIWRTGFLVQNEQSLAMIHINPAQAKLEIRLGGESLKDLFDFLMDNLKKAQPSVKIYNFMVSIIAQGSDEWVDLDQIYNQNARGKGHVASTKGEIVPLVLFHKLYLNA